LAVGTRIQEVRLEQEENAGYHRGTQWKNPWDKRETLSGEMRQWDLGQRQMLDPVLDIRDTGGLAVVATTRWVQVADYI
jgi:hypothetical protein